jgi:hypothetical protein
MVASAVVVLMVTVCPTKKVPPTGEKVGASAMGCSLTVPLKVTLWLSSPHVRLTLPE